MRPGSAPPSRRQRMLMETSSVSGPFGKMAPTSDETFVRHYMRKLENETEENEILRILNRLKKVRVSRELLQSTGVGKMVQNIKKRSRGEVWNLAAAIVAEWKERVIGPEKILKNKKKSGNAEQRSKDGSSDGDHKNGDWSRTRDVDEGHHHKCIAATDVSVSCNDRQKVQSSRMQKSSRDISKGEDKYRSGSDSATMENVYYVSEIGVSDTKRDKTKPKSGSSSSAESKHVKKITKAVSEDGFTSSVASFEDVLGLNDMRKVKKKKMSMAVPPMPSSGASSSEKKSRTGKDCLLSPSRDAKKPPGASRLSPVPVASTESSSRSTHSASKMAVLQDISITSTLPEIQPNYKPQRHYEIDSPPKKLKAVVADYDDGAFMSSRHNRTQVFSGRRSHALLVVPSLFDACIKVLQDNVQDLTYLGGVPFMIIEPVLHRCTPVQLYNLEDHNNHLIEDTDKLWEKHCIRDFRNPIREEFETWRELYLRLYDERETRLKSITANISASMAKAVPVRKIQLAYVDCEAKPPRNVLRQQAKFGTGRPSAKHKGAVAVNKNSTVTNSVARPSLSNANSSNFVTKQIDSALSSNPIVIAAPTPVAIVPPKVVKKPAPLMQKVRKLMKSSFRR